MKLNAFYKSILKFAKQCDPRKTKAIKGYEDTAILYGHPDTDIKKIMVGIDIDVGELMLADKLRQEQGLDMVVAHHPEGGAWAQFYKVMRLQVDLMKKIGISQDVANQFLQERMHEVQRRVMPANHMRSVDAARLIDMPFICVHTPADNHVYDFLKKLFIKQKPKKVKDIIDILMSLSEYKEAAKNNSGPRIISGNPNREAGEIFLEMTGGTEGSKKVFGSLYKKGVRTLVSMHLSEEHLTKVRDANLNVVIAGHISSDNLGLNLLLDKIGKIEKLKIIECSGFRRFQR